jgi:hypothetical protein
MFTRIRQKESTYKSSYHLVRGDGIDRTYTSTYNNSGLKQTIYDAGKTKFRPGRFSLNDVEIRKNSVQPDFTSLAWADPKNWPYSLSISGCLIGKDNLAVPDTGSAVTADPLAVLESLYQAQAKLGENTWESGVAMGELVSTAKMVASPIKALAAKAGQLTKRTARYFRRAGIVNGIKPQRHAQRRARKALEKQLSSNWLEAYYGWLPLMSDVEDAQKAFSLKAAQWCRVLRSSRHTISSVQQTTVANVKSVDVAYIYYDTLTSTVSKTTGIVYYYEKMFDRRLGASIYDIPGVLWELIPYSFVLDWVFNFGTWLNYAKPKPNLDVVGNCVSTINVVEKTCIPNRARFRSVAWPITITGSSPLVTKTQGLSRVRNVPTGNFYQFNRNIASLKHVLDGIALSYQKLSTVLKFRRR